MKNYNIGFQFLFDVMIDIGVVFYKVCIDGVIGIDDLNVVFVVNDFFCVVCNVDGLVCYFVQYFVNFGVFDIDGFDFNFCKVLCIKYGMFMFVGDWIYVWYFKLYSFGIVLQDFVGNNFVLLQLFGVSNLCWKGNMSVSWDYW